MMTSQTRFTLRSIAAVLGLLVATPPLGAQAPGSRAGEPITGQEAVAAFDSAWSRIRATHYDSAMRGVDWSAVRDSLRPRAEAARSVGELRATITMMLATLGESHFVLIPQEIADGMDASPADQDVPVGPPGDVGLELRLIGDSVMVSGVRAGSPAARAGVRPGWVVDSVGRFGAGRAQAALASASVTRRQLVAMLPGTAAAQFIGTAGTAVHATFRDGRGQLVALEMRREPLSGVPVRFGNLPAMFVDVQHETRPLPGGGCAGVIRFNAWMLPAMARLDSAVDAVRHCRGVVVDIRGNPGGVGAMIMGFGGHFLDSSYALGTLRTRSNTLRFVANPRRTTVHHQPVRPIAAPLAIVVDSLSMSTSEIFAAGMRSVGRARLFGETTRGLALPAVLTRLPGGDVLMHVFADFTDPDGRRIEGRGAVVDVPVPVTRAALLAGQDAPLDAALTWIAGAEGPTAP